MKMNFLSLFIVIGWFSVFSVLSYSQIRESGVIQGHIIYEGKPLPSVNVTLEGPKLIGGPRTLQVDARGFYKFPLLMPGEYRVKAQLSGFTTVIKKEIRVHANRTLIVDIKMTMAKIDEEVIVEAVSPMVDVKSSSPGGVVITADLIESLPLPKKYLTDILNMAPGVSGGTAYNTRNTGFSNNSWQIDGVEMTNPNTGSINQFFPDFNIIEEVNVEGLGLAAEYGEYTGTVVTATTKSGSNKFYMQNELRYNGDNWNAQNRDKVPLEEWSNPFAADRIIYTQSILSLGSQFGYRILKDKLWFFVSGEYWNAKNTAAQTTGFVQRNYMLKGFFKLTYQLNASNKLNGSTIISRNHTNTGLGVAGGGAVVDPEIGADTLMPNYYMNLNWTSIFSSTTFLETKFGFNYINKTSEPRKGRDIPGRKDLFLQTITENITSYSDNSQRSFQIRSHFSKFIADFVGSHDVKIGTEFILNRQYKEGGYPGNEYYEDWNGEPYRKYAKPPTIHDQHFRTIVGFFQNRWTVTKRLTLNLGLRYNNYWYKIPAADRGVIYKASTFSPRVGLSFDIFGDRKTVFKLNYGRYAEAHVGAIYAQMESRYYDEDIYEWNGSVYELIYSRSTKPSWADLYTIDPDLKQPYIQEFAGGFTRELFRNASLRVSFYYRTLGRTLGTIDIGTEWTKVTITNPGPDGIEGTSDDRGTYEGFDKVALGQQYYLITNPKKGISDALIDDARYEVKGIEFVFTKRFSKWWQIMASYNYAIGKGNSSGSYWAPRSPNSLIRPYGEVNKPLQNLFKLHGNFILPFDISLGVIGRYNAGTPLTASFYYRLPVAGAWQVFYGGEMGEYKTDSSFSLSIRAEKIFRIFGGSLHYSADINNLFNTYRPASRSYIFGDKFQKVQSVAGPRSFRISVRFKY